MAVTATLLESEVEETGGATQVVNVNPAQTSGSRLIVLASAGGESAITNIRSARPTASGLGGTWETLLWTPNYSNTNLSAHAAFVGDGCSGTGDITITWPGSEPLARIAFIWEVAASAGEDISYIQVATRQAASTAAEATLPHPNATVNIYGVSVLNSSPSYTPLSGFSGSSLANSGGEFSSGSGQDSSSPSLTGGVTLGSSVHWLCIVVGIGAEPTGVAYPIGPIGPVITNVSAGATTVVPSGRTIPTGRLLVARAAADNAGTNGAAATCTVTDSSSNTWNAETQANQDPGAANAGTTLNTQWANVTTQVDPDDAVTFSWSPNVTAKVAQVDEWVIGGTASKVDFDSATGASTTPSVTTSPTAADQLVIGSVAIEGPSTDTHTLDSDTTNGSWNTLERNSTFTGTAASNQTLAGQWKLVSASGDQTYNTTITSRDWATSALVLEFDTENVVTGTLAAAFGFSAALAGLKRTQGTLAASFGFAGTSSGLRRVQGTLAAPFVFTSTLLGEVVYNVVLGTLAADFGFASTLAGLKRTQGTLAAPFGFTTAMSGVRTSYGSLMADFGSWAAALGGLKRTQGTLAADFGFASSLSGLRISQGALASDFGWVATFLGDVIPSANLVTGVLALDFGFAAALAGLKRTQGTLAAPFGFTAASSGLVTRMGSLALDFGFAGTDSGVRIAERELALDFGWVATLDGDVIPAVNVVTGSSVLDFGWTATLSGLVIHQGTLTAPLGFSMAPGGTRIAEGTSALSGGFTAALTGIRWVEGELVLDFGWVATASGVTVHNIIEGSASADFGYEATLAGTRVRTGAVSASFGWVATASGLRTRQGRLVLPLGFSIRARDLPGFNAPGGYQALLGQRQRLIRRSGVRGRQR